MYKSRSNVFPRSICLELVIVCLVLLSELTAAKSFAQEAQPQQEAPPQTEEQRQARQALNEGVQNFKSGQYDECAAVSGDGLCLAIHSRRAKREKSGIGAEGGRGIPGRA